MDSQLPYFSFAEANLWVVMMNEQGRLINTILTITLIKMYAAHRWYNYANLPISARYLTCLISEKK